MTSPHHLHATRTTWALDVALTRLHQLARLETRHRSDQYLAAADRLRSPIYGVRHATGDHADPVGAVLTAPEGSGHTSGWVELSQRAHDRLTWIATQFRAQPGQAPLTAIRNRIPMLLPGTAALLAKHLADEDTWIRAAVRLEPAGMPLVGVPCPRCGHRTLTAHTDGPTNTWTITCTCLCVGQGCRCGMPGAVEGAQHIWPRNVVLTPATTSNEGESDRG
ncbi:hypothetical protein [Micromonospora inyonensis]|uniref:Uncharacterized protein n=1 Tax=Micromonospora inyonensis TaxID=47866 RepID=A0A1C6RWS2_9ACTN|nr:hypothetical protein [Micromonospora inyonensis]SCL21657.1 hypothetical protein GA0074694_3103 [Micromonospora inyonensis]